jgi:hypothetical protein
LAVFRLGNGSLNVIICPRGVSVSISVGSGQAHLNNGGSKCPYVGLHCGSDHAILMRHE